jgi:hypothetical protein
MLDLDWSLFRHFNYRGSPENFLSGSGALASVALGLDLPDALSRHRKLLADLFQRVVGIHADAKAHAQHALLATLAGYGSDCGREFGRWPAALTASHPIVRVRISCGGYFVLALFSNNHHQMVAGSVCIGLRASCRVCARPAKWRA